MYRVRDEFDRPRSAGGTGARSADRLAGRARFDLSQLEINDVLGWIFRSLRLITILGLAGVVTGFCVYGVIPPRYTAHTDVLIEPGNLKVAANDLFPEKIQSDSQLLDVESKMRVIASGNVLQRVVDKLKLADDPDFARPNLLTRLINTIIPPAAVGQNLATLRALSERVKVVRQERSYVVTVSVWGETPQQAVDISKAIVEAFETELNDTEAREATRIASSLQGRLGVLKDDVAQAEAKVETYRAKHGLQKGAGGQLVNSQSLDSLNDKIADVRVQVMQAATHYREVAAALRDGTQTDALKSPVMTSLRIEQATLSRKVASLSSTYGASFPTMIEARDELRSLDRAISGEQRRLYEAAKTEVTRLKTVQSALEADVATMKKTVSVDDRDQVQLRELERTAAAKSAVYQAALTRAGEVSERGRLDAVDVRAITDATLPVKPNWPPPRAVLALAGGVLGLLIGAVLAVAFGVSGMMRSKAEPGFPA